MKKLKLKGNSQNKTIDLYIQYYINNYIIDENKNEIVIKTVDGIRVKFYNKPDIHAYTKSRKISYRKSERYFDFDRALRLPWIKETITESCKEEIFKKDTFDPKKSTDIRSYFIPKEKYFLLLKKNKKGDYVFKSHYVLKNHKEYLKKVNFFGIL